MNNLLSIDLTAIIVAGIAALTSLATLLINILIAKKQNIIHTQINGMQEKLLTATGDAKKAEGELKGAADNQAITDAKPQDKK